MQIVFASAECAPFVKTGGGATWRARCLRRLCAPAPRSTAMVPKYATIKDEYKAQMEHFSDFYLSLGWRNEYCGSSEARARRRHLYVRGQPAYFARDYPYGFFDDGERFAFFSRPLPRACSTCLRALSATSCTATTGRRHWRPCSCASSTRPAAVRPRQDCVLDPQRGVPGPV